MYIICHSVGTQEIYVFPSLFSKIFTYLAFFLFGCTLRHVGLPWPGLESVAPAVGAQSLNHWTPGKSSSTLFFSSVFVGCNQAKGAEWGRSHQTLWICFLFKEKMCQAYVAPQGSSLSQSLQKQEGMNMALVARDCFHFQGVVWTSRPSCLWVLFLAGSGRMFPIQAAIVAAPPLPSRG